MASDEGNPAPPPAPAPGLRVLAADLQTPSTRRALSWGWSPPGIMAPLHLRQCTVLTPPSSAGRMRMRVLYLHLILVRRTTEQTPSGHRLAVVTPGSLMAASRPSSVATSGAVHDVVAIGAKNPPIIQVAAVGARRFLVRRRRPPVSARCRFAATGAMINRGLRAITEEFSLKVV